MKILYLVIIAFVTIVGIDACDRKDDPCAPNQCCFIRINRRRTRVRTRCRSRNIDTDRCAQNDYCIGSEDCDDGDICEGFGIEPLTWGRCRAPTTLPPTTIIFDTSTPVIDTSETPAPETPPPETPPPETPPPRTPSPSTPSPPPSTTPTACKKKKKKSVANGQE